MKTSTRLDPRLPRSLSPSPSLSLPLPLSLSLLLSLSALHAATLTGNISNVATGNLLEGAQVAVPSLGLSTLTDNTGRYVLPSLPAGTHEVVVTYVGLDPARTTVTVNDSASTTRNFDLTSVVYKLDAFKVTGEREGGAAAITAQRNAENVKNIVAMDSFGNLPNMNAAEVAIRLPGVAGNPSDENLIDGFTIRGIGPGLNSVTLDGSPLTSQGALNRSTNMNNLTGSMFDQMELTKGHTPDKEAGSIGGTINLKSRSPLSMKERRRITYSAGVRYAPSFTEQTPTRENHRAHPLFNVGWQELFDVFGGERNLGLSLNVFYSENAVGGFRTLRDFENTTAQPAYLWDYRTWDNYNLRKQASISLKADYRLAPSTKLSINTVASDAVETFRRQYETRAFTTQAVFNPALPATGTNATAGILPGYTDRITQVRAAAGSTIEQTTTGPGNFANRMRRLDVGAEHVFGALQLDYNALYTQSNINGGGGGRGGILVNRITAVGWRLDRTDSDLYPRFTQTEGPDFNNAANYRPTTYNNSILQNDDQIKEARANARYTLPVSFPLSLKSGAVWRQHYASAESVARRWNYAGTTALPSDPTIITFDSVKTGRRLPQWEPVQFFADRQPITPSLWREDLYFNEQNKYTANRAVTENVTAGYALASGRVGRTGLIAGVRTERTETSSWGWVRARTGSTVAQQTADPVGSATRDYAGTQRNLSGSYTKSFPSAHLTHDLTSDLKARLSWSTSFGRPPLNNALPNETISETNQTLTVNNPSLLPQNAATWDATLEYYFEPVGTLSLGWFNKTITDYIIAGTNAGTNAGTIATGNDNGFNGEYAGFTRLTSANAGTAKVSGWEFNYQQQFTFLPGLLKGFGASANYTLIRTNGNFGGTTSRSTNEVPGFIPRTGNATLSWRYKKFSTRLLYNFTGSYITAFTAATPGRNLYRFQYATVNAGVSYQVRPNLQLTLDAANLTNEPQSLYRGVRSQMQNTILNGTSLTFGVNGRF